MRYIAILLVSCLLFTEARGQEVQSTYKIRIAAMANPFERSTFDPLKKLGLVLFEPADNGFTRIYLGQYLGARTAKMVLRKVKQMGYKNAYLVKDAFLFQSISGRSITHTLQFSAVKSLDMTRFNSYDEAFHEEFFIWYSDGYYRLSLGLFSPTSMPVIATHESAALEMGYDEVFERAFRSAPTTP